MKNLYFIRHGQSVANAQGKLSGSTDSPLTDKGRTQAKEVAQEAKNVKIDLIVSSSMSRALETAQIIADNIGYPKDKIIVSPLLVERDFGVLEGAKYRKYITLRSAKGSERIGDMLARSNKALDWISAMPEENILVVSHGSLGRAFRHHITKYRPFYFQKHFKNGEIVKLV